MRSLAIAAMVLATAFFGAAVAIRLVHYGYFGDSIMDDAFFFVRYGNNFLDTGVFAWNRGEGPVYGNTSQLYQLLVTLVHWLTDRNVILTPSLAAAIGALAYLVALLWTYVVSRPQLDPKLRFLVAAFLVCLIAFDGQLFLLLGTGMETTWAMTLVTLSLLATFRVQNGNLGRSAVALNAVAIALVYAVRPDAVLLALAAPAGLVVFSPTHEMRLVGLRICLVAAALVLAVLGLCWLYYGDALPLAFIAKSIPLTTLPPDGRDEILGSSWEHLWATLRWHMPETVLGLMALALFRSLSPVLRGAALGMLAFALYHCFFVLPIMGYFGRFFAPLLPVLSLLALHAIEIVFRRSAIADGFRGATVAGVLLLAGLGLLTAHKVVPTAVRVVASHLPALKSDPAINTKDGALAHVAHDFPFFRGRMVQMVQALGDDCSIAATEDGLLSAYARLNRIVDYSGLHDRAIVREGFSAERLLLVSRPDVLTMPPHWYDEWSRAMQSHPALARDYVMEPAFYEKGYPIAFRRDSACAARVRKAVYGK
jgi:hypothetical protein